MKKKIYFLLFVLISSIIAFFYLNNSLYKINSSSIHRLTKDEKSWLKHLKSPITVGISNIPNQVILKPNQKPTGFAIDVFSKIEKELGIKFKYVYFNSWSDLINAAKANKIDIVFLAQRTEDRLKYLNFTKTILTQYNRIIIRENTKNIKTIKDLYNKRVSIVKDSALYDFLKDEHPEIILVPVKSELEALKEVENSKAVATIAEPVRASYFMKLYKIDNLMIDGIINYNYYLHIASSRTLPMLHIILSKTVDNLSKHFMQSLYLKWGYTKEQKNIINKQMLMYILLAFGIILPIVLYLYLMNSSLKKEILKRKKAEDELKLLNKNLEDRVNQEVEARREQEIHMLKQEKLAQVGNMVNMIAHQWKQPLNNLSIIAQTVVIKYRVSTLNDESIEIFNKKVKEQIEEMLKVMHDFMNFFNPNSNQKLTPDELIKQTISIVEPSFVSHGVEIIYTNKLPKPEPKINDTIKQVILNIINNGKDALIEKEIKNKKISITAFNHDGHTIIEIQDNAGGIQEEIINKIFDPYFSTKTKKGGTGLGLYMSKIIIENHYNGKLLVSNTKDGALFKIIL